MSGDNYFSKQQLEYFSTESVNAFIGNGVITSWESFARETVSEIGSREKSQQHS